MIFRAIKIKKSIEEYEQKIEAIIVDSVYNQEINLFSNLKLAQIDDYYYKDEKII
jgi:hypothetical protein